MPPKRRAVDSSTTRSIHANVKKRGEPRGGDGSQTDVTVPKGKPGNTKQDQEWVAKMTEAGLLEAIGADEKDVPFGSMLRYTGVPEDDGHSWQIPPDDKRCHGYAKIRDSEGRWITDRNGDVMMRPCLKWPIRGGTVCVEHGGGVESVRKAAQLRLLSAADSLIGALISIGLDAKADPKARVQAINSALDRAGVKGTIDLRVEVPQYQQMLKDLFSGEWGNEE
jgi:hypothetical protein